MSYSINRTFTKEVHPMPSRTTDDMIQAINKVPGDTPGICAPILATAQAEGQFLGLAEKMELRRAHAEAQAEERLRATQFTEWANKLKLAEEQQAAFPVGEGRTVVLYLTSATCLFISEAAMAFGVLPTVFSVPRYSLWGLAITVAPALCTIAGHSIIKHLPWQPKTDDSVKKKGFKTASTIGFLFGLAALILQMAWQQATTRHDVIDWIHNGGDSTLNIRSLFISLTICITVMSAYLLYLGWEELNHYQNQKQMTATVNTLRASRDELLRAKEYAQGHAEVARLNLEDMEKRAELTATEYYARKQFQLAKQLDDARTGQGICETIDPDLLRRIESFEQA